MPRNYKNIGTVNMGDARIKHYQTKSLSAAGSSTFILLDPRAQPFSVSVGVELSVGADLTYTVEHTLDEILSEDATTTDLTPTLLMEAQTASSQSNYFKPVMGCRLRISTYVSGTATLRTRQAGGNP